jgi:hypothetical protein
MGFERVTTLFKRTKQLEQDIDEFLEKVVQAGLIFRRGLSIYLEYGASEEFDDILSQEKQLESRGDTLRRSIETHLYSHTLIPDLRGDVLSLLENMDDLINEYEGNLFRFSIQQPVIPEDFHRGFAELTETVVTCVESVVMAARAFFRDIRAVRDHNNKVMFYETEADKMSTRLQRAVFSGDLPLENKRHISYFVERIDDIANAAEDIADRLAIYAIKREA